MSGHDVIEIVDDSDDDENTPAAATCSTIMLDRKPVARPKQKRASNSCTKRKPSLPANIVLEDDAAIANDEDALALVENYFRAKHNDAKLLFQDNQFPPLPSSIHGPHQKKHPTCRCKGSQKAKLQYKLAKNGRPYYACAAHKHPCNFFCWAFSAETMHWYRFGKHTGHTLVDPSSKGGFCAADLCQGRVGDCWFLSALAVVAERPDLIARLFDTSSHLTSGGEQQLQMRDDNNDDSGIVKVKLFLDGYWKTVIVDNFLPCIIDSNSENQLQQAIQASMGRVHPVESNGNNSNSSSSSKYDCHVLADSCRETLRNTREFVEQHQQATLGTVIPNTISDKPLRRMVTSQDLAYSKAKKNQLWVPLLEKAYAKSHGCYSAISGGHIAEAFLDLTGAPTLVYQLLNNSDFEPRSFWYKLLRYRQQRLPMGCGTDSSAAGIIGMHAYSILNVLEVKHVPFSFFHETGVAHGNVSGFTNYDGTVRLLQIRNPHGKGEWKGDFSDRSQIWEKLLQHQQQHGGDIDRSSNVPLTRTMQNDGTFWIDYDNFLMGFSNVDVVLAFLGNHAKSISSNFPAKKSNHRCARAFDVSLIEEQPGLPSNDTVEVYIMGIQKTRRGASKGRADRKKSYKVCDLGILVGEGDDDQGQFTRVKGEMFGFRRDGHYRLALDRKTSRRMVVMPISFGHPAATDKELPFVLRFVSTAPLLIRELPEVPRMDMVMQKYCLEAQPSRKQGSRKVLLEDTTYRLVQVDCRGNYGGVVFLCLCVNETMLETQGRSGHSFAVEATCRGMSCRTENGLLDHDTVAKGKKFEAAWRRYSTEFECETRSRLLLVLFQSGQDTEFGSIVCKAIATPRKLGTGATPKQATLHYFVDEDTTSSNTDDYPQRGVFNSVTGDKAFDLSAEFTSSIAAKQCADGFQQGMDFELEQALALSQREDHQFKDHVELENDLELQRALKLSKREAADHFASAEQGGESGTKFKASNSCDDDLSKAIQLSLQEAQTKDPNAAIDLTEEEMPQKRKRHESQDGGNELDEKRRLAANAALERLNQS